MEQLELLLSYLLEYLHYAYVIMFTLIKLSSLPKLYLAGFSVTLFGFSYSLISSMDLDYFIHPLPHWILLIFLTLSSYVYNLLMENWENLVGTSNTAIQTHIYSFLYFLQSLRFCCIQFGPLT